MKSKTRLRSVRALICASLMITVLSVSSLAFAAASVLMLSEASAQVIDGRAFVPLRWISEQMGYQVDYNGNTKLVTVGDGLFTHVIGTSMVTMADGNIRHIDVASYILNDRTMVSLRLFAEALDSEVAWDPNSNSVTITGHNLAIAHEDETPWKTIINQRFNFGCEIPAYWDARDESANGDGYIISTGDDGLDLRVYGSNGPLVLGHEEYLALLVDEEGYTAFTPANDMDGWYSKEEGGTVEMQYVYIEDDTAVVLYMAFDAASNWYANNPEILHVAVSLAFLP